MNVFKIAALLVALVPGAAFAQFPASTDVTTSAIAVPIQCDVEHPCSNANVALVTATTPEQHSGGVIQLSAFGWLEPYVDTLVQVLITAVFGILAKSKYTQWLDQSSRDALETFLKNRAASLIADGAVTMKSKSVQVDNGLLYRAASESATAIPAALKRFNLTPDIVAAKIIDAIPQTTAGAEMVANAHASDPIPAPVPITDRPPAAPGMPPVTGAA